MTAAHRPLHASAVAIDGRGVLILGASGTGKSGLALHLMALGARLIADDRTCLGAGQGGLLAWSPPAIIGRIEARGIGILRVDPAPPTRLALAIDLDRSEPERLPPPRHWSWCDITLPLIFGGGNPFLPHAILQWMRGGRDDVP